MFQIDHVQYLGEGNTGDEANDNAASKYLKSIDTGVHRNRANQAYARDVVPNVSIIKLHEMYGELDYRTVVVRTGERNKFKTTIQVRLQSEQKEIIQTEHEPFPYRLTQLIIMAEVKAFSKPQLMQQMRAFYRSNRVFIAK